MKQWLKKQKYKIAIALCSILSIFTLFLGINKTYAYETDIFSYTMNIYTDNTYTNEYHLSNYQTNTILIENCIELNENNRTLFFNINDYLSNIPINKYYLMINFYLIDSNNNISYMNDYNLQFTYMPQGTSYSMFLRNNVRDNTNNMFTFISNRNTSTSYTYNANNQYFLFTIPSNSKIILKNIDYVYPSDIGLSQYYDTYYGQIEDNYNTLLSNYNDLQDSYDTLESNYNTLESNYNTLESNYNILEDNYSNLLNNVNSMSNMGIMQFINKIDFTYYLNGGLGFYEKSMTLLEIMESDYFNGNFFDIQQFSFDWAQELNISTNNELVVEIDFIPIDIDLFTFRTEEMEVIDYRNISLTNDINNVNVVLNTNALINQQQIENVYGSTLENYKIKSLYIEYRTMGSDIYNHSLFGSDISITQVAYNRGFNMAKQQYESLILELNNKITANEQTIQQLQSELEFSTTTNRDLNTQIDNLETENTRFRYVIASLEAQLRSYQESSNDYNLNRMIWTIASTPFESFKQIWNVDFFGVNISTMITGFITGIIVLWIIKKFFL